MSTSRDYLEYLNQKVDIAPVNSEEEYQAARTIESLMQSHGLETRMQDFVAPRLGQLPYRIVGILLFVGVFLSGLLGTPAMVVGILLTLATFALLALHHAGIVDLLGGLGGKIQSQNVIGIHRATGPLVVKGNRPIVIVAHYDTPRENLLCNEPFARWQPLLRKYAPQASCLAVFFSIVQSFGFIPSAARHLMWVIAIICALPLLMIGVADLQQRFAPCTEGSNDNKSGVAALLGVMSMVHPGDDEATGYGEQRERRDRAAAERARIAEKEAAAAEEAARKAAEEEAQRLQAEVELADADAMTADEEQATAAQEEAAPDAAGVADEDAEYDDYDEDAEYDGDYEEDEYLDAEPAEDEEREDEPAYIDELEEQESEEEPVDVERENAEDDEESSIKTSEEPAPVKPATPIEHLYEEPISAARVVTREAKTEEILGVRHGQETLEALHILPASCEIIYKLSETVENNNDEDTQEKDITSDAQSYQDAEESYEEPEFDAEEYDEEYYDEEDDGYLMPDEVQPQGMGARIQGFFTHIKDSISAHRPLKSEQYEEELGYEDASIDEQGYIQDNNEPAEDGYAEDGHPDEDLGSEEDFDSRDSEYSDDENSEPVTSQRDEDEYDEYQYLDAIIEEEIPEDEDVIEEAAPEQADEASDDLVDASDEIDDEATDEVSDATTDEASDAATDEASDEVTDESADGVTDEGSDAAAEEAGNEADDGEEAVEASMETRVTPRIQEDADGTLPFVPLGKLADGQEVDEHADTKDPSGLDTLATDETVVSSRLSDAQSEPAALDDPNWGKSNFRPTVSNVARRAVLFDLPDPLGDEDEVDPLADELESTAKTSRRRMSEAGQQARAAIDAAAQRTNNAQVDAQEQDIVPQSLTTLHAPASQEEKPKNKRRRGLFRRANKVEEEPESLGDWLGVGDDYDAKKDGRAIGSWEHFDDDEGGKPRPNNSWKGGATRREGKRANEDDVRVQEELRDSILAMGDDELLAHDIWFVALGGSYADHAGMKAFLAENRRNARGSFVINLSCVGDGELTLLTEEGQANSRKADRRLSRLIGQIADDLHIELGRSKHDWEDTDATPAMRARMRAATICGLTPDGTLALSQVPDDDPDEVDPAQVNLVAELVAEVIRRS